MGLTVTGCVIRDVALNIERKLKADYTENDLQLALAKELPSLFEALKKTHGIGTHEDEIGTPIQVLESMYRFVKNEKMGVIY